MRTVLLTLVTMMMVACGGYEEYNPRSDLEMYSFEEDLGDITIVNAGVRGELSGQEFDEVTDIYGKSNASNTSIEFVYDGGEEAPVIMTANVFLGDIFDGVEYTNFVGLGCSGEEYNQWTYDVTSSIQQVTSEENDGVTTVNFRVGFDSGEWMTGSYDYLEN